MTRFFNLGLSFLFIPFSFLDNQYQKERSGFLSWSLHQNFSEAYKNFVSDFQRNKVQRKENLDPAGRGS